MTQKLILFTNQTSSEASQLSIITIIDNISPGAEIAIGISADSAFTLDIYSAELNIKK